MDAMREHLDVLTGANRNGDVQEVNRKYFDRDVCRLFLAGLCPHDLFQLTKMDLGPCPKVHWLQLRKDYEEVKEKGSENFELEDMIDEIMECERKIQRALKRLDGEDVTEDEEVVQLSNKIKEKMKEVDTFDFEGKTDDKIKAMEVVEELRSKRVGMQATLLLDDFNKGHALIPQPAPTQIAPLPPPPPPDARTQELINEKLSKAEALGQQGMVEEAQKALEEAEALKKELASDPSMYTVADVRIESGEACGEMQWSSDVRGVGQVTRVKRSLPNASESSRARKLATTSNSKVFMTQLEDNSMAAPSRPHASLPALPDELFEEILLRLPPDNPASFLRASLVSKSWRCVVSRPSFRRRLYELHRIAPVLGFLHDWYDPVIPHFIPTTASPFSLAAPDRRSWRALDCRHGRVIFLSKGQDALDLLVWEPMTGAHRCVHVPTAFKCGYPTAAVFCAADGCDHSGCHGGHFSIVFIFTISIHDEFDTYACVYSSETGTWGELTSMHSEFCIVFTESSSVLVGGALLYFISDGGVVLEYDLVKHVLTAIDTPDKEPNYGPSCGERFNLMLTEDGGLGLITDMDPQLKLWSRNACDGANARWHLSRVIYLGNSLPFQAIASIDNFLDPDSVVVMLGFAEGANAIFLNTAVGLFTMELQSERVRKMCDDRGFCNLIPVVSFYTPVPHSEHQDTTPLNPIEEAVGNEMGGEQENSLELRRKVIEDGSIASNKSVVTESAPKSCSSTEVQDEDVAIAAVIDAAEVKWEEQPFKRRSQGRQNAASVSVADDLPAELHCRLCNKVMADAVLTSKCCFDSFCDKCIRDYIITQSKCICGVKVLADDLISNHTLSSTISNMLGTRASSRASGTGKHKSSSSSNPVPKLQSPTTSAASGKDMKQYMDHLPPSASPGAVTDPYMYSSMGMPYGGYPIDPFGVNPFGNMPLQGPFGIPQGPFGNMPPQALAMQGYPANYQSRETHPARAEAAARSRQASHRDTEATARSRHASHRDADAAVHSRQTEDTGSPPLPSEHIQCLGSPHVRESRSRSWSRSARRDHGRSDRASNDTRSERRDHGRSDRASIDTRSERRGHGRSDRASSVTRSERRDHGRSDRAASNYAEDNHSRKRMRASSPADDDKQSRLRSRHSSRSLARDDSSDDAEPIFTAR